MDLRPAAHSSQSHFMMCCLVFLYALIVVAQEVSDTAARLQLLGSIVSAKGGVALVKDRTSGKIKAHRVGETIFGVAELVSVDRNAMVVREKDGSTLTLSNKLGGVGSGKKFAKKAAPLLYGNEDSYKEDGFARIGSKVDIDARYRDKVLKEELPSILMAATAEPVLEGGEIKGFVFSQVEAGSMFTKLGMRDGDVVTEINGVPLNNVAKTIQFLNTLREEPNVKVNIVRGGVPVSLDVNIK